MISKIYNDTVYKKELMQRNMDTKMPLLNEIKKNYQNQQLLNVLKVILEFTENYENIYD